MNNMKLTALVFKDLKYNFKKFIPVFFSVFFSVGMIAAIICYSSIIDHYISSKLKTDKPCILTIQNRNENMNILGNVSEQLKNDPMIKDMNLYYMVNIPSLIPVPVLRNADYCVYGNYEYSTAVIDKTEYSFDNWEKYTSWDCIELISTDIEYQVIDKENILCGNVLTSENQIVLPEQYLLMLGIKAEEYEQLIGKSFSLYITVGTKKFPVIKEFIISGIIDREYFGEDDHFLPAYIPYTAPRYREDFINIILDAVISEYDVEKVRSFKAELENSNPVDTSLNSEYWEIDFYYSQREFVYKIISLIAIFFAVATALHLIVYMLFSAQQTVKMSKMLIAMGLTENQVCIFRGIENAVTALLGTVSGAVIYSIIACKVFEFINSDIVDGIRAINLNMLIPVCIAVISAVCLLCFVINRKAIRTDRIR